MIRSNDKKARSHYSIPTRMDEATFDIFLQEQRAALADINLIVSAWRQREQDPSDPDALTKIHYRHPLEREKDLRTRFDTSCRRLADAYMICDHGQRARIRELLHIMTGVRASMGIPFTQIRLKMDAVQFRLALIYESMKDLGEDTRDAQMALDNLCRAARLAGIDPDPYLMEIAAVSSEVDRHHKGSMKSLLLERTTGGGARFRCSTCGNEYSSTMARCPFCESRGADSGNRSAPGPKEADSHDVPDLFVAEDESPIYLPTHKLIGVVILAGAASLLFSMALVEVLVLCFVGELSMQGVYCNLPVQITCFVLLCVFRFDRILRRYSTKDGRPRLRATGRQVLTILLLFAAAFAVLVWFLATFARQMGI